MNKFLERLNGGQTLIADGATGTNLQRMGLKPGTPPEDLVIDNPDLLLQLASAFVEAGSDMILTCTFGGTRLRMKDSPYADRAAEINRRAAELARKAASARACRCLAGTKNPAPHRLAQHVHARLGSVRGALPSLRRATETGRGRSA